MSRSDLVHKTVALIFVLGCVHCGDDFHKGKLPQIEVMYGAAPVANGGSITVPRDTPGRLTIANTGGETLLIRGLTIESSPQGAFTVEVTPIPSVESPLQFDSETAPHEFLVRYDLHVAADPSVATAVVRIATNATANASEEFSFKVTLNLGVARLEVRPIAIDFGRVEVGLTASERVELLNTGGEPLTIVRVAVSGHPAFTTRLAGQTYNVGTQDSSTGTAPNSPLVIAASSKQVAEITLSPTGTDPALGQVAFLTDNGSGSVDLRANTGECPAGYERAPNGECVDANACLNYPCGAQATCNDLPVPAPADAAGRSCECDPGYEGDPDVGCNDADACLDNPCGTGASCIDLAPPAGDGPDDRQCECPDGYEGDPTIACIAPSCSDRELRIEVTAALQSECADGWQIVVYDNLGAELPRGTKGGGFDYMLPASYACQGTLGFTVYCAIGNRFRDWTQWTGEGGEQVGIASVKLGGVDVTASSVVCNYFRDCTYGAPWYWTNPRVPLDPNWPGGCDVSVDHCPGWCDGDDPQPPLCQ